MGFGGKMCIDGTFKTDEEKDELYIELPVNKDTTTIENQLKQKFPELSAINASLLLKDIPCLVIAIQKNRVGHIAALHPQIAATPIVQGIKMILYVEHTVDPRDLTVALWRFCNNLDPKRDFHLYKENVQDSMGYTACMGLDGTRKTKEFDHFQRDWPNIIVADDETIAAVDKKWNQLGLGAFIPSPSLKFKDQMYGEEAIVS